MNGSWTLALVVVVGCGKQLNPEFCDQHPTDPLCTAADAQRSGDGASDVPMGGDCPSSYTITIASQPGSRYRADDRTSNSDWDKDVDFCAADGVNTHLVVLSSATELADLAPYFDRVRFIGLSDKKTEGTFVAVTDEVVNYPALYDKAMPPWKAGEPDNNGGTADGDCVAVTNNLELEDRECSNDDQSFLCECDAYANNPANY